MQPNPNLNRASARSDRAPAVEARVLA